MRGFGEYEVPAQRERDTCVDVNAVLRSNAANAAAGVPEEKSTDAQTVRMCDSCSLVRSNVQRWTLTSRRGDRPARSSRNSSRRLLELVEAAL